MSAPHTKQPADELPDAESLRCAIVVSRYHSDITAALLAGAQEVFLARHGKEQNLLVVDSPGAFELTAICGTLARGEATFGKPDVIVTLGCVLTGETTHDQHIAQSIRQGITSITVNTGVPIAFGVLTCQTMQQAKARAMPAHSSQGSNKGAETMEAAIEIAHTIKLLKSTKRNSQ
ncbi:MAG TPA: 6,7-dimethyl-8-ribityllumazine synthase [Phycisphaerales bacterium]|nr:6,7-dimethyl-8-ribityllumazine synthase [Phycisphaerales bacterium]